MLGVGATTLLVLFVGLVVSRKVAGDSTNFLVAGRALTLPLVAASLMGQAVDANATLGNTDLASSYGFWAGASLPIGLALCLALTGRFVAAPMNRMGLLTLPDFYKLRYGRGVELASSVILIVSFCILLAGNLVVGGLLFDQFLSTGYTVGVLVVVALVLLYTITGGMFSNAYGAVVQMGITLVAAVALLVWAATTFGLSSPDGYGAFDLGQLSRTEEGAAVNWATLVALGIGDIVAIDFMQRIFSAKDVRTAQRACYLGAAGTLAVGIPFTLVALTAAVCAAGRAARRPDPVHAAHGLRAQRPGRPCAVRHRGRLSQHRERRHPRHSGSGDAQRARHVDAAGHRRAGPAAAGHPTGHGAGGRTGCAVCAARAADGRAADAGLRPAAGRSGGAVPVRAVLEAGDDLRRCRLHRGRLERAPGAVRPDADGLWH
jgi:hypothetical protein